MILPDSILFATGNRHKREEVGAVLGALGIRVEGLSAAGPAIPEPVEDGRTFLANALIKARYYAEKMGRLVLADDSGLEVDALGGEPGVRSARYSGVEGGRREVDPANNARLLDEMRAVPDEKRTARFVCVLVLADPQRTWAVARGEVEGRIVHAERGRNGFGYDPLFLLPERGVTTAELSPEEKNAISHRGNAARELARLLKELCR